MICFLNTSTLPRNRRRNWSAERKASEVYTHVTNHSCCLWMDKMEPSTKATSLTVEMNVSKHSLSCILRGDLHLGAYRHYGELIMKLGPHDVWYAFMMRDATWFAHGVYEEICVIWVDVSFVHSSHLAHQVGSKLTHIKANGSWISVICYLVQTIIYRNTSNIGIWQMREWIRVEILPKFLSIISIKKIIILTLPPFLLCIDMQTWEYKT